MTYNYYNMYDIILVLNVSGADVISGVVFQDVLRVLPLYISDNESTILSICFARRISTQSVRLSDIPPPNTFALAGL